LVLTEYEVVYTLYVYTMSDGPDFDWDKENVEHIARHEVLPEEVERAFANDPITLAVQIRGGEERFLCAGLTDAGRAIQFVYTVRSGRIRIITAHTSRKARKLV